MSARRILITGGSGFLGSALVKVLVGAGEEVRVFDDNSRGALRRLREVERDVDFVSGDIRDAAAVDAAMRGIDRGRIADVAADELDVAFDLAQPAQSSAGIVVEHAHGLALAHERLDQTRTEEAAAAGDQNAPRAHSSARPSLSVARRYHIASADGKPISNPYKRP